MADIRVKVPDSFMNDLKLKLGVTTNNEVIQEALTLLSWAADEKMNNRLVLSTDVSGNHVHRLAMRALALPASTPSAEKYGMSR